MTDYTYSRVAALNFTTTPVTVGRSATGSVYAIGDTTYTTPLNVTMVVGGATGTSISSDANGFFPDFTVANRTSVVFKQAGTSFTSVLTTTDPVPGAKGDTGAAGAPGVKGDRGDLASWQPTTFYPLNQVISNPVGDLVKVTTAHTSTGSYDATKFDYVVPPSLTPAALNATYGASVLVTAYGAVGDGVTDDKAAIDAALVALAGGGTLVFPGGKNYKTSGGHIVPVGTKIEATGATAITHTGDNICFNFNQTGSFNLKRPGGIVGANIVGNSGVNAVGVEFGNAWGLFAHNVNIGGYSAGVGIDLHNKTNWTEGSSIVAAKLDSNKTGIRFRRTTGTFSFGYTSILDVSVNVPTDGIGVDFGATSADTVYLYSSDIRATVWPLGNNAISLRIAPTFNSDNVRLHFTGEVPGNASGSNHRGVVNEGGTLRAYGHFLIKDGVNETTLGQTQVLAAYKNIDTRSGNAGGLTWQAVLSSNPDVAHNAQFGYLTGTNTNIPYVSGFDQQDAFRAYSTPLNGKPAVEGKNVLRVHRLGHLFYGPTAETSIQTGTGKPNSVVTANRGSLYVRRDDAASLAQAYIKTTDGDNTGWAAIKHKQSGTTAQRPATADTADEYWDSTTKQPIHYDGSVSKWLDAKGVAIPIQTKLGSYSMLVTDETVIVNGATATIGLPDPTATAAIGKVYRVKNIFNSTITVNSQGTTKTIDGAASVSLTQWQSLVVISDGTQWLTF